MSLNNGKVFANQAYVVRTLEKLVTSLGFLWSIWPLSVEVNAGCFGFFSSLKAILILQNIVTANVNRHVINTPVLTPSIAIKFYSVIYCEAHF